MANRTKTQPDDGPSYILSIFVSVTEECGLSSRVATYRREDQIAAPLVAERLNVIEKKHHYNVTLIDVVMYFVGCLISNLTPDF